MPNKPTRFFLTCPRCKQTLARDCFEPAMVNGRPSGVHERCRTCRDEIRKERVRGEMRVVGGVAYLPLAGGREALIDESDLPLVQPYHLMGYRNSVGTWYVRCRASDGACVDLHRLIMGAPSGVEVDHESGDGLDNRRSNLRLATRTQNCRNRVPHKAGSSRFKGVYWSTRDGVWVAMVQAGKVRRNLGRFRAEDDAARAYDRAAIELHGEFARTNESLGLFDEVAA